jgi:hypothetical protein
VLKQVQELGVANFDRVDLTAARLEQTLREGGYDGFFCPQSDLIDYVMVQTGMLDRLEGLRIGAISNPRMNTHSRRFCQSGIIQWQADYARMVAEAARMLQEWVFLREVPRGTVRISWNRASGSDPVR